MKRKYHKAKKPVRKQKGRGQAEALANIERMKKAMASVGLTFDPTTSRAPTKWYETPFVGIRNAATETKHNPLIQKVLDHVPYVGSAVKTAADKIGRGMKRRRVGMLTN